ncbi:hypothetical protein OG21DRAFT_1487490 [Imleria badia]|nr:hypothetical protein OG21DRAFT_1487490 [Imleria badia]
MLAKNLWADKLIPALKTDSSVNKKTADPVPTTYEDICEWATVASKPLVVDCTCPFVLLYKQPVETSASVIYPVTVRLQGFLGTHSLTLFRTWDGTETGVPSAIQQLTLHSDGHSEIWSHYVRAIEQIRCLIHVHLGGSEKNLSQPHYALHAQRRVFTKMNVHIRQQPSVVSVVEDQAGHANLLSNKWRIIDRIQVGRWNGNKAVAYSPTVLHEGDFIDVGVSFDIFVLPHRHKSTVEQDRHTVCAHLNIEHVLQLCVTEDASELTDVHAAEAPVTSYDAQSANVATRSTSPAWLTASEKGKKREEEATTSDPPLNIDDPALLQPILLDPEIVRHYPGSAVCRFVTLANFCSTDMNAFTPENIPACYTWGEKRLLSSTAPFICNQSKDPITIWIVSSIEESTLTSIEPNTKMHGIAITLITQGIRDKVKRLITKLKYLSSRMMGDWNDIRSTCVIKTINDAGQKHQVPFNAVYDGHEHFSNLKEEMTAIPSGQLNLNDIVLVESRICRWSTKKDTTEKGWSEWGVKLDLLCVSLLHVAVWPDEAITVKTKEPFRI